jgi:hypothetical protein
VVFLLNLDKCFRLIFLKFIYLYAIIKEFPECYIIACKFDILFTFPPSDFGISFKMSQMKFDYVVFGLCNVLYIIL